MADFQSEIPEEYLDSDFDFGFTAVDADELEQITSETTDAPATALDNISSDRIIDSISEL